MHSPKRMVNAMISSKPVERRRTLRHPAGEIGAIVAKPGGAPRYCLVIDKSAGGVRIRTTYDFQAPSEFVLHFAKTEARYNVVWRNGQILGAELVTSA
jgi:hypothetical protein